MPRRKLVRKEFGIGRRQIFAPTTWPLAAVLLLGLVIRLALAPIHGSRYDIGAFQEWTRQMLARPLPEFYAADLQVPQDHLPGDLWVLYALGHVWRWLGGGEFAGTGAAMIVLKLVGIVLDLVLGVLAATLVRPLAGERTARRVLLALVFNPGLVFISAIWGQWNVLATTLVIMTSWLVMRHGTAGLVASLPVLAAASLVKPQFLVLLVPIGVVILREYQTSASLLSLVRRVIIGGAASVALVLAAILPFDVGFPGMGVRWTIVERVQFAAERFTVTTAGARNIWTLFVPDDTTDDRTAVIAGITWQQLGFLLFGIACLYAVVVAWRWTEARLGMLVAFAIITTALFMVLTRSHERYLVPGMVLTIMVAAIVPRVRPAAWVLSAGLFINVWTTWGKWHHRWVAGISYPDWLYQAVAVINLIGFGLLLWHAWPRTDDRAVHRSARNVSTEIASMVTGKPT